MYLVTSAEMRAIDRHAIDGIGLPALVLMENAGRAVAEEVMRLDGRLRSGQAAGDRPRRWLILVGKGNNGGDGIVAARHLAEHGYEVHILYATPPDEWQGEAAVQRDIASRIGLGSSVYGISSSVHGSGPSACNAGGPGDAGMRGSGGAGIRWEEWDGIVDALLGTGASGPPREPYASLIREACASGLPIVSVDLPSGLNADTGEVADPCIRATVTVALGLMKRGLLLYPGAEMAGEVVVRPIGIPEVAVRQQQVRTFVLDEALLSRRFGLSIPPARKADTHKGTYGHVLVAAGSRNMSGAGLLCSKAALRSGAGLVTWAVPEALALPLAGRLPEVMITGMPDGGSGQWGDVDPQELAGLAVSKDAVVVGPGMGRWPGDWKWLRRLWESVKLPLVLDADALNMLAEAEEPLAAWPRRHHPTILTPHPGEMARLCGMSVPEVQRDRIGLARRFAVQHGVTLALKGARTVVAGPDGSVYVNTTGNPGMATGGAGDVLAGIIAGLLAQGVHSSGDRTTCRAARTAGGTADETAGGSAGRAAVGSARGAGGGTAGESAGETADGIAGGTAGRSTGGTAAAADDGMAAACADDGTAATAAAVYWHGLAGDRAAAARHSAASLIAGDIIEAL